MARIAFQQLQHPVGDVVGHERLPVVLPNVPIHREPRLAAKVAEELARIVVLDDDRPLAAGQDLRDRICVERHNPLDLELIDCDPLLLQLPHSLLDGPVRRAPSYQRDVRVRRPLDLRLRHVFQHLRELAGPLLHHPAPLVRVRELVADELGVLVMLVRRDHVHVPLEARQRPGRYAVFRVLVALVTVRGRRLRDQLPSVDSRLRVDLVGIDAVPAFGDQQV